MKHFLKSRTISDRCLNKQITVLSKMGRVFVFLFSSTLLPLTLHAYAQEDRGSIVFYISPSGNNTWSGKLKQPNLQGNDGPFATLEGARDALRALRKTNPSLMQTKPVLVYMRDGLFQLTRPIRFEPEDSGTRKANVTYAAFPGERPILSSGQRILGWKPASVTMPGIATNVRGKLWVADVPKDWRFNQLFLDGEMLPRSASPNTESWEQWHHMSGAQGKRVLEFNPESITPISNLADAEINVVPSPGSHFLNFLSPIKQLNFRAGIITLSTPSPYPLKKGDSFRVENTLEGIDQPGEWSLDTQQQKVYLWPARPTSNNKTQSIDPNTASVTAPRLSQGILIQGNEAKGKFVRFISLRGLTFTLFDRTRADQPAPIGGHGGADTNDAVITLTGVENVSLENNTIKNVGGTGIRSYLYAKSLRVINNKISNCGGAGLQFQGYPPGAHNVNRSHWIERNHIHDCGQIYWHSSGISLAMTGDTHIFRNRIDHMPYAGIFVSGIFTTYFRQFKSAYKGGFRWGEIGDDPLTVQSVKKFIPGSVTIEKNIVHNVMQRLDDGGAIYLAGSHHNIVRNNYIYDCPRAYAFGIYLDMDEINTQVENNIVRNCPNVKTDIGSSLLLHINGLNSIRNNIFIAASSRLFRFIGSYGGQQVNNNIFQCDQQCAQGEPPASKEIANLSANKVTANFGVSQMNNNLYWSADAGSTARNSLAWMNAKGFDSNSIVADPGLSHFDSQGRYQIRPNSPIFSIKFQPIKIR